MGPAELRRDSVIAPSGCGQYGGEERGEQRAESRPSSLPDVVIGFDGIYGVRIS